MNVPILAIVIFAISAILYIISIRSFLGKGFLFNNAYIFASQEERARMDKKPHYRQSAIVFLLLGTVFLFNGLAVLLGADWPTALAIVTMAATIIYAVVSDVKGKK